MSDLGEKSQTGGGRCCVGGVEGVAASADFQ